MIKSNNNEIQLIKHIDMNIRIPRKAHLEVLIKNNFNIKIWNSYISMLKKKELTLDVMARRAFELDLLPAIAINAMAFLAAIYKQEEMYQYILKKAEECFKSKSVFHKHLKEYIGLSGYIAIEKTAKSTYSKNFYTLVEKICNEFISPFYFKGSSIIINGIETIIGSRASSSLSNYNLNALTWKKYLIFLEGKELKLDQITKNIFSPNNITYLDITYMAGLGAIYAPDKMYQYLYKFGEECFKNQAIYHQNFKEYIGLKTNRILRIIEHKDKNTFIYRLQLLIENVCHDIEQDTNVLYKVIRKSNGTFLIYYKNRICKVKAMFGKKKTIQLRFFNNSNMVYSALRRIKEGESYKKIANSMDIHESVIMDLAIGIFPELVLKIIKNTAKKLILNNSHILIGSLISRDIPNSRKANGDYFVNNYLDTIRRMQKVQRRVYKSINYKLLQYPKDKIQLGMIYKENFSFQTINIPWYDKPIGIEFRTFMWKKGFRTSQVRTNRILNVFLNQLIDVNPRIMSTSDITQKDIEVVLGTFNKSLGETKLSIFIKFLQYFSLLKEISPFGKMPESPTENITKQFISAARQHVNHLPIPEVVYQNIYSKLHLLRDDIANAFLISSIAGCRVDEFEYIHKNSLKFNTKMKHYELIFSTPKNNNTKNKKGKLAIRKIPILDQEVIKAFQKQEKSTRELRKSFGINSIFVYLSYKQTAKILNATAYSDPINQLIKKYNITDEDGKIWHFTGHQLRASIATRLAESGYAAEEIMAYMGWESKSTLERAYVILHSKRLMELNSSFFYEHFKTEIPEENLNKLNLSERQSLFTELYINFRQMEYGKCVRHPILGECGKLQEPKSCAPCSKLITSKEYLPKWYRLRKSEQIIFSSMEKKFEEEGINKEEYQEWVEYIREKYILDSYNDLIKKLEKE